MTGFEGFCMGVIITCVSCVIMSIPLKKEYAEEGYNAGLKNEERQRLVRPIILQEQTGDITWYCPECEKETTEATETRSNYCSECGCKIDWEGKINDR